MDPVVRGDYSSIDITVTAVNDIPVNAVPGAQTTDEDVPQSSLEQLQR